MPNSYAYNEELMLASIAKFHAEERAKAKAAMHLPPKLPPQPVVRISRKSLFSRPLPPPVQLPVPALSAKQILGVVAARFHVSPEQLRSRTRAYAVVRPRQLVMLLLHECCRMTLGQIGQFFNAHHTTALHSIRIADARCLVDPQLKAVRDQVLALVAKGKAA